MRNRTNNPLVGYSDLECELIRKYLTFYIRLDEGKAAPSTPGQQHFVEVCRGDAQPETAHEFAYLKYKIIEKNNRRVGRKLNEENRKAYKKRTGRNLNEQNRKAFSDQILPEPEINPNAKIDPIKISKNTNKSPNSNNKTSNKKKIKTQTSINAPSRSAKQRFGNVSAKNKVNLNEKLQQNKIKPKHSSKKNKHGIPEFEDGSPKPGFDPLGKFQ